MSSSKKTSSGKKKVPTKGKTGKTTLPPLPILEELQEILLEKCGEQCGVDLHPPQDVKSWKETFSYQSELPPLSTSSGPLCYKTSRGINIPMPTYEAISNHSSINIPVPHVEMDYQGVKRCWNMIRFFFYPCFEQKPSPATHAMEAEKEGQPQAEEELNRQEEKEEERKTEMGLVEFYDFLRKRGECFDGSSPFDDEAKWKPLYKLIKATFYTQGNNDEHCKVYARPRGCFIPLDINNNNKNHPPLLAMQEEQKEAQTSFWKAIKEGDLAQVSASLEKYPELVNLPNYMTGHVPLTSVAAADNSSPHLLHLLLASYAFTDGPGPNGDTALHLACQAGHLEKVKLLLSYGADPHLPNTYGETSLHMASAKGHTAIVILLLSKSKPTTLNPTTYKARSTPLHLSTAAGHLDTLRALIQARSDLFKENAFGFTPLMVANKSVACAMELYKVATELAAPPPAPTEKGGKGKGKKGALSKKKK